MKKLVESITIKNISIIYGIMISISVIALALDYGRWSIKVLEFSVRTCVVLILLAVIKVLLKELFRKK